MDVVDSPKKSRGTFFTAVTILLIAAAVFVFTRRPGPAAEPQTAKADVVPAGVIEATGEQLNQIRVEPVREQTIDVNLEATGRVGFNEDRVTPVLAPYPGRVLELLATTGDVVKAGQPLLVIESPDIISAVNDLAEARTNVDKTRIALDIAQKSAERA